MTGEYGLGDLFHCKYSYVQSNTTAGTGGLTIIGRACLNRDLSIGLVNEAGPRCSMSLETPAICNIQVNGSCVPANILRSTGSASSGANMQGIEARVKTFPYLIDAAQDRGGQCLRRPPSNWMVQSPLQGSQ